MGKLIYYLTALIFLDLLFITTGQICNAAVGCSLTSIIFNALLNLENILHSSFYTELIGNFSNMFDSLTGIMSMAAIGGVTIAAAHAMKEFRILLLPIVASLALIAGDFVFLTVYLLSISKILTTFIMGPLLITYMVVLLDWLKGHD